MQKTCPMQGPNSGPSLVSLLRYPLGRPVATRLRENNELESDKILAISVVSPLRFNDAAFTGHNSAQGCARVEILVFHYFREKGDSAHIQLISSSDPGQKHQKSTVDCEKSRRRVPAARRCARSNGPRPGIPRLGSEHTPRR